MIKLVTDPVYRVPGVDMAQEKDMLCYSIIESKMDEMHRLLDGIIINKVTYPIENELEEAKRIIRDHAQAAETIIKMLGVRK